LLQGILLGVSLILISGKYVRPLKAVRGYCLWCMNGSSNEVSLCPSNDCSLYQLRFGKRVKGVLVLRSIKKRCQDCGETPRAARKCEFLDCALYPYRLGHNPARQGLGGKREVVPPKA